MLGRVAEVPWGWPDGPLSLDKKCCQMITKMLHSCYKILVIVLKIVRVLANFAHHDRRNG